MLCSVNLPGSFAEKKDALVISFWIISSFTLIGAGLFFSAKLLGGVARIPGAKQNFAALALLPVILSLAILLKNLEGFEYFIKLANHGLGIFFMFIFPLIIIVTAKLRKGLRR